MRSSEKKFKVDWIAEEQIFLCKIRNTNVAGRGPTPIAAINSCRVKELLENLRLLGLIDAPSLMSPN